MKKSIKKFFGAWDAGEFHNLPDGGLVVHASLGKKESRLIKRLLNKVERMYGNRDHLNANSN